MSPLVVRMQKLFRKELAAENDYLRAENRILRGKFGKRVPLTDQDRRTLVKYPEDPVPPDNVECEPALGGLLNHYHAEKAA